MNNFILSEMSKNSFYVLSSGRILGKGFNNIRFKIDTGCTYSTIPLSKLYLFDDISSREFKKVDIESDIEYQMSYGVESSGIKHNKPKTFEEKMNCPALKFRHRLTNFVLGDYKLPDTDIFVNYDRHGNILIGMDILSKFDIHIGTSLLTGKETLIAVLKTQDDKSDYYKALYENFNLIESNSAVAEGFRKVWNN